MTPSDWTTIIDRAAHGNRLPDRATTVPRPKPAAADFCDLSDLGNARLFVRLFGQRVRYCHERKKWYVRAGGRWQADDTGAVDRLAKRVADLRWRDAWERVDYPRREFARRSASVVGIKAILRLARSEPGIAITADELDAEGTP